MKTSWSEYYEAFNAMGKYKTQARVTGSYVGEIYDVKHQIIDKLSFKVPKNFINKQINNHILEIVVGGRNDCRVSLLIDVNETKDIAYSKAYLEKIKAIVDDSGSDILKTEWRNDGTNKNTKRVKLAIAEKNVANKTDQYKWFELVLKEVSKVLKDELN